MSKENNQSEQKDKKPNINESQNTTAAINALNIQPISDNNDENEKEDSLSKNNKLKNSRYKNNDNENGELFPFQKKYSAEVIAKNALNEDDEEDEEDLDNPLAKKNMMTSQKKVVPKKILSLLKSNVLTSVNKDNKGSKDQFSLVQKNENSFYYEDNNNNLENIKSEKIKNPINNIIPRLNEQINNNSKIEQLKKDLQNNDNTKTQQLKNNIKKCCLEKYGDTSYLNTIIQCLANIENLKIFFLNDNIKKYLITNINKLPLSFVTQRIFEHFYVKRDSKYTLESFLRVLGSLNHIYASKKSRNANECLMFILDSLHNELNRIREINQKNDFDKKVRNEVISYGVMNYKNQYDCIISDNFNWQELKELHCTECGERSYDFKTYNTFQLDCLDFKKTIDKNIINIYDCLEYELNITKKAFCCYCRKKADIKSISGIYSSPRIFVFLLNSGNFDENLLNLNFKLETVINLKNFIENKKSPIKYDLVGVISMDIRNKKYINYCKSFEDQQWYFYWEENVAQITEKQVILDNSGKFTPSVLFYKSIN